MTIPLSWDLFVLVFAALVVTYTLIIGKKESIKIILSTYLAIVSIQGIGNILDRFLGNGSFLVNVLGFSLDITLLSIAKLVLFIATMIILAVKAGFEIHYKKEHDMVVGVVFTVLFGIATSGLLVASLLTYAAGVPLLDPTLVSSAAIAPIVKQSVVMQTIIENQDVLFALPVVLLLTAGFMGNK